MGKRWVWAMAIGLVLLGGAWKSAAGLSLDLTNLKIVCIEKANFRGPQVVGLSQEEITNYVYVLLKGKLPRLQVELYTGAKKGACVPGASFMEVIVDLDRPQIGTGRTLYGGVTVYLYRRAFWESGKSGMGIAYKEVYFIIGSSDNVKHYVDNALDNFVTEFAAEYYKAGNP